MKKFCAFRLDYCSIFASPVEVHFNIQIPQAPMGRKDGANQFFQNNIYFYHLIYNKWAL